MSAREDLARRMLVSPDRGARCSHCGDDAKQCQAGFVVLGEWCCSACRVFGPRALHTVMEGPCEPQ